MKIPKDCLIVSCQSEGNDPFNSPEGVVLFARAAEMGGAHGIRSEGILKTKRILQEVQIPVIGLIKSEFKDGTVRVTGNYSDVEDLLEIGCNIIAVDGTKRLREGVTGHKFIHELKRRYKCTIMADIATLEEALECQHVAADYISSTLNGYTPDTISDNNGEPNFKLVEELVIRLNIPVFAEGRISNPKQAKQLIELGAYGVVVGTMITRPRIITNLFADKIIKWK